MGRWTLGVLCCGAALATITETAAAAPANDLRASAASNVITSGATVVGTLKEATAASDPAATANVNERNVWYRVNTTGPGTYTLDVCGPVTGSTPSIAVFASAQTTKRTDVGGVSCDPGITSFGGGTASVSFRSLAAESIDVLVYDTQLGSGDDSSFSLRLRKGPNLLSIALPSAFGGQRVGMVPLGTAAFNVYCAIDAATLAPCTSSLLLDDVPAGDHTFHATAHDEEGTPDPEPTSASFTIDRTAPDTKLDDLDVSDPQNPLVSLSATDNVAPLSINYQCAVGDDPAFASCAATSTLGNLCSGPHKMRVRAVDASGNVDATPVSITTTVPAGHPCTPPEALIQQGGSGGLSSTLAVDTGGHVVSAAIEYGPTTDYGFTSGAGVFGTDSLDAASAPDMQTIAGLGWGVVTHMRAVMTDENGTVTYGPDQTVTQTDPSPGGHPTLTVGTPVATPTTLDVPYTLGGPFGPLVGSAVVETLAPDVIAGIGGIGLVDIAGVSTLPTGRTGTLQLVGLEPDTAYHLLMIGATTLTGTSSLDLRSAVVRTAKLPDPPAPPAPPSGGGSGPGAGGGPTTPGTTNPGTTKPKSPLSKLKLPKKLLLKLLKTRKLKPQLTCTAACSLRVRLLKGKVVIAQGTAKRKKAGTSSITLKPTKAGLKAIKKVKRHKKLKVSLVADALAGKKVLGSIKRTVSLR